MVDFTLEDLGLTRDSVAPYEEKIREYVVNQIRPNWLPEVDSDYVCSFVARAIGASVLHREANLLRKEGKRLEALSNREFHAEKPKHSHWQYTGLAEEIEREIMGITSVNYGGGIPNRSQLIEAMGKAPYVSQKLQGAKLVHDPFENYREISLG